MNEHQMKQDCNSQSVSILFNCLVPFRMLNISLVLRIITKFIRMKLIRRRIKVIIEIINQLQKIYSFKKVLMYYMKIKNSRNKTSK